MLRYAKACKLSYVKACLLRYAEACWLRYAEACWLCYAAVVRLSSYAGGRPGRERAASLRAKQRTGPGGCKLPRPGKCVLRESLFGLLIEDVQVLGIEDGLERLARSRLSRGVDARDELVSVRR